jgi:hypothetical protein
MEKVLKFHLKMKFHYLIFNKIYLFGKEWPKEEWFLCSFYSLFPQKGKDFLKLNLLFWYSGKRFENQFKRIWII